MNSGFNLISDLPDCLPARMPDSHLGGVFVSLTTMSQHRNPPSGHRGYKYKIGEKLTGSFEDTLNHLNIIKKIN